MTIRSALDHKIPAPVGAEIMSRIRKAEQEHGVRVLLAVESGSRAPGLFARSNPAFVEWIQSPIVYREDGPFADEVRKLLPDVYSCERGIYHYRSMAKTNYRGHLRADLVPLKKYFYVLRPLLSVRWLERYGKPAPIEHELDRLEGLQATPMPTDSMDALNVVFRQALQGQPACL